MDEEYASEITQIAVARACLAVGFKQCEKPVLESLADIVQHYIRTLGSSAQEQAELSGRPHAGIQDVIPMLESTVRVTLHVTHIRNDVPFLLGLQRPKHVSWKELRTFAFEDVKNPTKESDKTWCQPFPFDVPNFPVASGREAASSSFSLDPSAASRDPYIPSHLPAFPPAHTLKRSSGGPKKRSADASKSGSSSDVGAGGIDSELPSRKAQRRSAAKTAQSSLAAIEDSIDSGLRNP